MVKTEMGHTYQLLCGQNLPYQMIKYVAFTTRRPQITSFHDILCLFSYPMTKSLIQNGHWLMDFPKWIQSIQDAMLMLISNQMQPGLWLLEDNCNFEKYFTFPILNLWLSHGFIIYQRILIKITIQLSDVEKCFD